MTTHHNRHVRMVDDVITNAAHERPAEFAVAPGSTDYDVSVLFVRLVDHRFSGFTHQSFHFSVDLQPK